MRCPKATKRLTCAIHALSTFLNFFIYQNIILPPGPNMYYEKNIVKLLISPGSQAMRILILRIVESLHCA